MKSLLNLVGKVSENELKYQLRQMQEQDKNFRWTLIINLVGKVSDREIKYQIEQMEVK
jgi:hypothetical protein